MSKFKWQFTAEVPRGARGLWLGLALGTWPAPGRVWEFCITGPAALQVERGDWYVEHTLDEGTPVERTFSAPVLDWKGLQRELTCMGPATKVTVRCRFSPLDEPSELSLSVVWETKKSGLQMPQLAANWEGV